MELLDGNAAAALMLSQIVYWYRPSKDGKPKLRVLHDGMWWIAKSYVDWRGEVGLTLEQARHCVRYLVGRKIIETKIFKFDGSPTMHLRLVAAHGSQMLKSLPTLEELGGVKSHTPLCDFSHPPMGNLPSPSVKSHISKQILRQRVRQRLLRVCLSHTRWETLRVLL